MDNELETLRESDWSTRLSRVSDWGVAASLLIAPLAMGGRFPIGRLLLGIIVATTAVSWFAAQLLTRREKTLWTWSGAEWIAALAVLLVALQLVPLAPSTVTWLSPKLNQLLRLQTEHPDLVASMDEAGGSFVGWDRITLVPHATRSGLAMAIVYALLFLVLSQRLRRRSDIERLLKLVATAGILMATLGLAQYLFGNGKFLWFVEHPSRDTFSAVKGTFANENHFAHFLALTVGPLIWWLISHQESLDEQSARQPSFGPLERFSPFRTHALFVGLGVVLLAGLLTYSRGGLVMMMLAAVVTTMMFAFQKRIGKRAVLGTGIVMLVAAAAVWIHGQDGLAREIDTLANASLESLDQGQGRRKIWAAVTRAIPDFAILGSGVGSHRYIYPTYFSEASNVQYTHAESGFLQVMLEAGGPGFGLLLVGIGISAYWLLCAVATRDKPEVAFLTTPLVASWCVSLVHGFFDFNWYIPANMTLTVVVLAAASRVWLLSRPSRGIRQRISTFSWASMTTAAVMMAIVAISQLVAPARASRDWHEFRAWSLAAKRFANKSIGAGRQRTLGLVNPSDPETIFSMMKILDRCLEHDPRNGRAHVRMASLCLRQFELLQARSENAMSLAQIRDAALASEFSTHDEMRAWVARVVEDHQVFLDRARWHAYQGIRLIPTEGNGYMYLAEVAFLDEALQGAEHTLLLQAYAVRPFNPSVQFVLGHRKLLDGDAEAAMTLWKEAFRRGDDVRRRIIATIGFEAPPAELLRLFNPDVDGLRDIFEYYRRKEMETQLHFVGQQFVAELESQAQLMTGEAAGRLWFDAQFAYSVLGDREQAAAAAEQAVRAHPTSYDNHFACALRLREAGRYEAAAREFRWCLARRPNDELLVNAIRQVEREMRQHGVATAERNLLDPLEMHNEKR